MSGVVERVYFSVKKGAKDSNTYSVVVKNHDEYEKWRKETSSSTWSETSLDDKLKIVNEFTENDEVYTGKGDSDHTEVPSNQTLDADFRELIEAADKDGDDEEEAEGGRKSKKEKKLQVELVQYYILLKGDIKNKHSSKNTGGTTSTGQTSLGAATAGVGGR